MRPGFLVKIGGLILLRSWRATVVLSVMVVSAVAALVFLSALAVGTNDAMIRNSTGLFSGQIAASRIGGEAEALLLNVPGVARVLSRIHRQVLLRHGDRVEPILLVGVSPEEEKATTALWRKTVTGRYLVAGEAALYLNQETARRLNADAGALVSLETVPGEKAMLCTLVGLYKTGISQLDQGMAFTPIDTMPGAGGERSAAVFLRPGTDEAGIVTAYRKLLPDATFTAWTEFMPDLKQLIDLEGLCMALVIILVFAIVSVGIACAFLLFALKNLREHGIMKAMGVMAGETALLLTTQVGLLTVSAAVVGALLGALATTLLARTGIDIGAFTSHNQYFSVSGVIHPRLTAQALLASPLAAIVFGLAAAVWPTLYLIRKSPADILRGI